MTYKINSVEITLQPTSGRWLGRRNLGDDGAGHPVYPAVRKFELVWGVVSPDEYNQLQTFYETVTSTGTASVDLPKYADSSYAFYTYTGCVLSEPVPTKYFTEYYTDVTLLVGNIHT